jgi:hypothetical protein
MNEFRSVFPLEHSDGYEGFYLMNGGYIAVEAHVYYAMIRHFRPKRIIEIAMGNSTLLAGAASLVNKKQYGQAAHLTAIATHIHGTFIRKASRGFRFCLIRRCSTSILSCSSSEPSSFWMRIRGEGEQQLPVVNVGGAKTM